ncbi:RICIN domain-containing protein [Saccharothrix xinjiangensis]|uniref:RICIN domain-containing protein n=1 Tax=Saccharothrix xinjiangensis TaxID=204798 RepID=A0ABV9XYL0_9PSEU
MRRPVVSAIACASVLPTATALPITASAAPAESFLDSYLIPAQARYLALSVEDHSSQEGAPAELAPPAHLTEQQWELSENDITHLENVATGKCLQFTAPRGEPSRRLVQITCDYHSPQTWYYVAADDHFDTWRLENAASHTCIATPDLRPGGRLVEEACDEDDPNQRWTAVEAED